MNTDNVPDEVTNEKVDEPKTNRRGRRRFTVGNKTLSQKDVLRRTNRMAKQRNEAVKQSQALSGFVAFVLNELTPLRDGLLEEEYESEAADVVEALKEQRDDIVDVLDRVLDRIQVNEPEST